MPIIYQCAGKKRGVCDYESDTKWRGRCPVELGGCGRNYNIIVKGNAEVGPSRTSLASLAAESNKKYIPTGMAAFDKVAGCSPKYPAGGIVPGAPYVISGPQGTGKTTLLMTLASLFASEKRPVLYASGEQSRDDIADLAQRINTVNEFVEVKGNNGDVYAIAESAEELKAKLVVIDSINTASCDDCDGAEGSSAQIKAVANFLSAWCKRTETALIGIAHVGKDGEILGPTTLGHLFDTLLELDPAEQTDEDGEIEPDTKGLIRLTSGKNRHGESGVSALFKMTASGVVSMEKKSRLISV